MNDSIYSFIYNCLYKFIYIYIYIYISMVVVRGPLAVASIQGALKCAPLRELRLAGTDRI